MNKTFVAVAEVLDQVLHYFKNDRFLDAPVTSAAGFFDDDDDGFEDDFASEDDTATPPAPPV